MAAISKGKDKFRCGKEKFSSGIAYNGLETNCHGIEQMRTTQRWSCGDTTRREKYGNGNAKRSQEERRVEKEIKMGLYKKINELEEKIERQIAINEAYKKFVDRADRLLNSINDKLADIDARVRKLERRDIDDGK